MAGLKDVVRKGIVRGCDNVSQKGVYVTRLCRESNIEQINQIGGRVIL